jgi:GMP synthase (glutamine-hydrolysing)
MALWLLHHLDPPQTGHAGRVLREAGVETMDCVVSAGDPLPGLDEVDGLIVFGGNESARDLDVHPYLAHEAELLAAAVEREVPVLGICLGAQLLARSLGARVERLPMREVTYGVPETLDAGRADPLFADAPPIPAPHWNEDAFELPEGAIELQERSAQGVEAFRVGSCAWGVQYHPELDEEMLDTWYARYGDLLGEAGITEASARREDLRHADAQRVAAEHLFGAFAEVVARRRSPA